MGEDTVGEQEERTNSYLEEPWPEDVEQKRLDDLRRWVSMNPHDSMVHMIMAQVNGVEWVEQSDDENDNELQKALANPVKQRKTFERGYLNKWDYHSTTELLDAMNKFQECLNEMDRRGVRVTTHSRWAVISKYLPNRLSLEQDKFAMSCRTHFANLCRVYKGQRRTAKDADLPIDVRQGIDDYLRRCQHVRSSKKKQGMTLDSILKMMVTISIISPFNKENQASRRRKTSVSFAVDMVHEEKQVNVSYDDQMDKGHDTLRTPEECGAAIESGVTKKIRTHPIAPAEAENRLELSEALTKRQDFKSRRSGSKVLSQWKMISGNLPNHYHLQGRIGGGKDSSERYEHLVRNYKRELKEKPIVSRDASLAERASSQLAEWFQYLESSPANLQGPQVPSTNKTVPYSKCSPSWKTTTKMPRKEIKKSKYDLDLTGNANQTFVGVQNASGHSSASNSQDCGPRPGKNYPQKTHMKEITQKKNKMELPVDMISARDMSFQPGAERAVKFRKMPVGGTMGTGIRRRQAPLFMRGHMGYKIRHSTYQKSHGVPLKGCHPHHTYEPSSGNDMYVGGGRSHDSVALDKGGNHGVPAIQKSRCRPE